ncbi:hypothetical protein ACJX0J_033557, partial [Zea mays]
IKGVQRVIAYVCREKDGNVIVVLTSHFVTGIYTMFSTLVFEFFEFMYFWPNFVGFCLEASTKSMGSQLKHLEEEGRGGEIEKTMSLDFQVLLAKLGSLLKKLLFEIHLFPLIIFLKVPFLTPTHHFSDEFGMNGVVYSHVYNVGYFRELLDITSIQRIEKITHWSMFFEY